MGWLEKVIGWPEKVIGQLKKVYEWLGGVLKQWEQAGWLAGGLEQPRRQPEAQTSATNIVL